MKNIVSQQKQESYINKVNAEFAKTNLIQTWIIIIVNPIKFPKVLSNKKDLKILSECEKVKHVQEMPDGDFKFLWKLNKEYKSLLNKDNKKKTGGNLVVEIVPKDQNSKYIEISDKGDKVEVWGTRIIDEPKGWNEIHPT